MCSSVVYVDDYAIAYHLTSYEELSRPLGSFARYSSTNNILLNYEDQQLHSLSRPSVPLYDHTAAMPQPTPYVSLLAAETIVNVIPATVYFFPNANTYSFRCHDTKCHNQSFGRWYDFHRHCNGAHASNPAAFWCHVEGCSRSEAVGNRSFPRKDKLSDHVKKMHGAATPDHLQSDYEGL